MPTQTSRNLADDPTAATNPNGLAGASRAALDVLLTDAAIDRAGAQRFLKPIAAARAVAGLVRCGYGPRQPLLVISPFARRNAADHTVTDQSSILRFVEDNWSTGRIGNQSFDALAGPLDNMLDLDRHDGGGKLFLDPNTGAQVSH